MVAEVNTKITAEPKTINLHLDGFDIHFDYDSFSNKSFVTASHEVSIKMEGSDLTMRLGFKENEILREPATHCISVYGEYGAIYNVIFLHRYHSESVSGWCESNLT